MAPRSLYSTHAAPSYTTSGNVVIRARHPETHRSKLFSALVTSDDDLQPGKASMVTVVVVGGDADDYLAPGEHFALLRGCDVARGTVTSTAASVRYGPSSVVSLCW